MNAMQVDYIMLCSKVTAIYMSLSLLILILVVMATNVFEEGEIHWENVNVDSSPKPLLVLSPTVAGTYPVILFCHGFCIRNTNYSKLLAHIASHGFILVAPQLFSACMPMFGLSEVKCAGSIVDWIADGLQPLLPENVEAQLDSLVLAGHSRGGKTAFSVALGYVQTKLKFSVLIGIDPVAGPSKCKMCRTLPHILTYEPKSFNLGIPVLVIGTGLGPEKPNSFTVMACAPDGVNHEEFYRECKPPCAHFVAKEYGHMDMLDDDISGIIDGVISKCMCKNGEGPRELMRKTVAGLVVAFLRAHLKAQFEDLDIILNDPGLAPTKLEEVEYLPE